MTVGSAVHIIPAGPLSGTLAAPASKSVTNRLLVLAALATGESVLRGPLDSDDAQAMRGLVATLGVPVRSEGDRWRVTGAGGSFHPDAAHADARLSGTTMRFGAALATLADRPLTVTGQPPLLRRPIGPLTGALRSLGADVADTGGFPPVRCAGGGLAGGRVDVDAHASSQYVSAVLLVAPCAAADTSVRAVGLSAPAYVDLTVAAMADFGAEVERRGAGHWAVRSGGYAARTRAVEYDASAACHLYSLAAATGGSVTVTNASPTSLQPDAAFPAVLARMGVVVEAAGAQVTVTGPDALRPVDVDLAGMPDQVTSLAVLAALADGRSRIRGVAVARGHETDRIAALARELRKVGVGVEERPDGLVIDGGGARGPARLATYDDHRLAMAFAALGAAVADVAIDDPGCVAKTYPRFWDDARALGLVWEDAPAAGTVPS